MVRDQVNVMAIGDRGTSKGLTGFALMIGALFRAFKECENRPAYPGKMPHHQCSTDALTPNQRSTTSRN